MNSKFQRKQVDPTIVWKVIMGKYMRGNFPSKVMLSLKPNDFKRLTAGKKTPRKKMTQYMKILLLPFAVLFVTLLWYL